MKFPRVHDGHDDSVARTPVGEHGLAGGTPGGVQHNFADSGSHGIRRDEVMAFGDGLNDLEMMRWAGRSVAMQNGHPTVLDIASQVTPANDDDGVAIAIEEILTTI